MAGISIGITLEVVLMFGLGLPKVAGWGDFGGHAPRPQAGRLDIGNGVARDALLLRRRIENRRAVTHSDIVALAVERGGIVDLGEEFQRVPEARDLGIEHDLDRLGVGAVIAIGGIADIPATIPDPRGYDAPELA